MVNGKSMTWNPDSSSSCYVTWDILIKLMSVIALILVPILVKITPLWDLLMKLFK